MTAVADEVAAAAELVKGKLDGVPVAVVRGLRFVAAGDDRARGRWCVRRTRTCSGSARARRSRPAVWTAGRCAHFTRRTG